MEEHKSRPLEAEGLDCDFVSERLERARDGSVFPLDPGVGKPEDIRAGAVEKTVRRARVQPCTQFHAAIGVHPLSETRGKDSAYRSMMIPSRKLVQRLF